MPGGAGHGEKGSRVFYQSRTALPRPPLGPGAPNKWQGLVVKFQAGVTRAAANLIVETLAERLLKVRHWKTFPDWYRL
jgi:hypothetical protein